MVIALVPGALYVWAFERVVGRWGVGLSDRLLRFVGVSAILHVLCAPMTYWIWAVAWPDVLAGHASWWLWAAALGYALIPLAVGSVIGRASSVEQQWARWFTGPNPAPRAWDYLFHGNREGWIRIRLKSGAWLGGGFGRSTGGLRSYSAGYPEDQDLFLSTIVAIDPDNGEFQFDGAGRPVLVDGGILVRWDEVEYLEFIDV